MGHCDEIGCAVWATAAELVVCYGPLCGMKPYTTVKICDDFRAVGQSTGFGYALWAIV
jgi:hypothetical protein